jgi:uncharacterized protein YbjT (DUF2867 family)
MPNPPKSKLVTIFGGSGFLGRHVVQALAKRGYRIRVAVRRPDLAGHLQPLGNVGQIQFIQANLRYRWSVDRACQGADIIINLVGILAERGNQKFDAIQAYGAAAVAEAAKLAGAKLVHVSSLGADSESLSLYAQSKANGEKAVQGIMSDAIIMRPSIIFGPEDGFSNMFATMAQLSPVLPAIGGGTTKFQPVYVGDAAEAIALAVDGKARPGTVYELGGPRVATFKNCLEIISKAVGRSRMIVSVPWWMAKIMGRMTGWMPGAPITLDQVILLQSDNIVSSEAEKQDLTLEGLGIQAKTMEAVLPAYLVRFKPHGQYGDKRAA